MSSYYSLEHIATKSSKRLHCFEDHAVCDICVLVFALQDGTLALWDVIASKLREYSDNVTQVMSYNHYI